NLNADPGVPIEVNGWIPTLNEVNQNRDTRRRFLREKVSLFLGVEEGIVNDLADTATPFKRSVGDVLMRQGDDIFTPYIILRGLIEFSRVADHPFAAGNMTYYLPYRGPGEGGAHNNALCGETMGYTMRVVMPCDLLILNTECLKDAHDKSPRLR